MSDYCKYCKLIDDLMHMERNRDTSSGAESEAWDIQAESIADEMAAMGHCEHWPDHHPYQNEVVTWQEYFDEGEIEVIVFSYDGGGDDGH